MKVWAAIILGLTMLMVSACAGDSETHQEVTALFEELVPPDGYTADEISITRPNHDPFTRQLGNVSVWWVIDDPNPSLGKVTADIHEYFTTHGFRLTATGGRSIAECSDSQLATLHVSDQLTVRLSHRPGGSGVSVRTLWNDGLMDRKKSAYTVVTELPVCGDDAPGWRG